MYGRTYVDTSITLDAYRKRCMDIHLKKLNEIRKPVVRKLEETKRVEESINRRHQDKVRNHEFLKQGNASLSYTNRERTRHQPREQKAPAEARRDIQGQACKRIRMIST